MQVIRAFRVDTFMDDEVLAVLDLDEGMATMRAPEVKGRETVRIGRKEAGVADLAQDLSFGTVVPVEVDGRGIAARAGAVLLDVAFFTAFHWLQIVVIALFIIDQEILPIPVLGKGLDPWKFIDFELLVLRGMGIIKGPLL